MSDLRKRQWIEDLCKTEVLPSCYADTVSRYLEPLAAEAAELRQTQSRPVVVGISGAQGAGKSTMALFLAEFLRRERQLSTVLLSLDDFYMGKAERARLADKRHKLLATRGVPGTHDVQLALRVLRELRDAIAPGVVRLPRFDKASDDRITAASWPAVSVPVDVIILEGWCLGARAQHPESLLRPVNTLEGQDDTDGVWRRYVNDCLAADYRELFDQIDTLVMLRVPSFKKVLQWRGLQEEKLVQNLAGSERKELQIDRFVMHFERLTRHMLETMPGYADTTIDIDEKHRMADMHSQA